MKYRGRTLIAGLLVFALFVTFSNQAHAVMYVCKNSKGVMQFTNAPSASDCKIYSRKSKAKSRSAQKSYHPINPNIYDSHIQKAGTRYSIDPHLIKAVIMIESDFDRYAVSKTGARGLMQLMPGTAKELNVIDSFNPKQNINGGTLYLRNLLNMFDGDLSLTLAAYNAGPTLVKKINRIPRIPETVRYVKKVLRQYNKYKGNYSYSSDSSIRVNTLQIASVK